MPEPRQIHLNVFFLGLGHNETAWRLPASDPFAQTDIDYYVRVAQLAEEAKFDSIFFGDTAALFGDVRFGPAALLDPLPLLGALAMKTEKLGLIATASTTYKEPYDLARAFATIDHISGGRAGWNMVTSWFPEAARNFGRDQLEHHRRYLRADEFLQVATKLWDSWEDDAVVGDKAEGTFADIDRIHAIDHAGEHFSVAGPLNMGRPPQGWPVLVQAGSSESGRDFAARWAEAIFVAAPTLAEGQEFYSGIKAQVGAAGRRPDGVVVLPGVVPFLGATEAEAQARHQEFIEQIIPALVLDHLSRLFGVDLGDADLDGPLPEVPQVGDLETSKSRPMMIEKMARSENLTLRQLISRIGGGRGHREFTGTPEQMADDLETWFREGGADGFNLMPPAIPADLETFIDHVLPILRRRGLFREEYEGTTLREHYGLSRPVNQFAEPVVV